MHQQPLGEVHWSSTGADWERNLCAVCLILWTCWIPERRLNQPAADRAGVITLPSSHNWFIPVNVTCFPLQCAGKHRVKESCSIICPRAREPFFSPFLFVFHMKIFTEGKQVISLTWRHSLSLQSLPVWKRLIQVFSLIHFEYAWKCLVQVLWELSKRSTYKRKEGRGEDSTKTIQERTRMGRGRMERPSKGQTQSDFCRLQNPFPICDACAEHRSDGLKNTERKLWIRMKKTLSTRKNKICD